MTSKQHYRNQAVIEAFNKLFGAKGLSDKMIQDEPELIIDKVRDLGIILKCKKDTTKDDIRKIITSSMRRMIKDNIDNFSDYINEKYEFNFDMDQIDDDFVRELFSIKIDKKYVYIEVER